MYNYALFSMYAIASATVKIFSASSSGISMSNSLLKAITSSTTSSESAPKSSINFESSLTSAGSQSNCSTTTAFYII